MIHRLAIVVLFIGTICPSARAENKLMMLDAPPEGLSKEIAELLDPKGFRVAGPDGAIVDVWLVKSITVKADFKPSLSVKYPFTSGQLLGAMRVAENTTYTDFRGQDVEPGVYTLRYGQQPQDGNHIGTSDLRDFLLALSAKMDKSPKTITSEDDFHFDSSEAIGATHPAIFSLLPMEKPAEKPTLEHDEEHDFWILQVTVGGQSQEKRIPVSLRLVTIGESEG